jgi:parvulin-like peptidyl-prolyl isomerase
MMYAKRLVLAMGMMLTMACGSRPPVVFESELSRFQYPVARAADGYELTMARLQEMLARSELLPQGGILPVEQVRPFLDSVLADTLAGMKAVQIRLENDKLNHHLYRLRYNQYLGKRYRDLEIHARATVDSQEVVTMVSEHPDLFTVGEHVHLYQILVSPAVYRSGPDSLRVKKLSREQFDMELKDRAFMVRELAAVPDSFLAVAGRYSDDVNSKRAGGKIGWTERGLYYDPFDSVAFSMRDGDVSQPYLDRDGWHILYVDKYMPAGLIQLDKFFDLARDNAAMLKLNARAVAVRDSLRPLVNLVYNDKILDKNVYYQALDDWVAILNGQDTIRIENVRGLEERYRKRGGVDNTTAEMKKEMVRELTDELMLVQAARALRIDTLPDVVEVERGLRHKYCKAIIEQARLDPTWEPSAELVEYYLKMHEQDFTPQKPLTVQQIVVPDRATGEFVRDQAMAGVDFLELADKYYIGDPTVRRELADLGPIGPEDVSTEFYHAALTTPVGETSHPVLTPLGYQIVKVLSRRDALTSDDARVRVIALLKAEHAQELQTQYRDRLFSEYGVKFTGKIVPVHLKPLIERTQ